MQAYFQYDSKKTGGVTISHLRFGDKPIRSPYYINQADFVACHNPAYIHMGMKMVQDVKPGGVFMINCQWTDEELGQHLNAEAKKYIADNNIQLYTINAIDKAIEIGMGKRTNTILQSAFFKLADVMPIDDAINFMKQAAQKSYGKKGQDVVEMNWKAIDAGVDAIHKVEVPAEWANPEADPAPKALAGRPELVKQIREVMEPIARMDGDSLPVSSFLANANGEWEQGASATEKRGTAVTVPEWDAAKCVGCNQCAFVCSHATIRPFQLTAEELAAAPAQTKSRDNRPANEYSSSWQCFRWTAWAAASVSPSLPPRLSPWCRRRARLLSRRSLTTAWPTSPRSPASLRMIPSSVLSSTSRCWSSPAPALAVPRPLTHA